MAKESEDNGAGNLKISDIWSNAHAILSLGETAEQINDYIEITGSNLTDDQREFRNLYREARKLIKRDVEADNLAISAEFGIINGTQNVCFFNHPEVFRTIFGIDLLAVQKDGIELYAKISVDGMDTDKAAQARIVFDKRILVKTDEVVISRSLASELKLKIGRIIISNIYQDRSVLDSDDLLNSSK